MLPRYIWHGVRLQDAEQGLAGGLRSAAGMANPNIAFHVLSQTWPKVLSGYKLHCLGTSGVAGSRGVVSLAEHVDAEVVGGGDV